MPIQIPGARLIEQMIAGLPTNSQQAIQLRELAAQIEILKRENDELKAQLAKTKPPTGLEIDAIKILKLFFEDGLDLIVYDIAHRIEMEESMVQYHIDELVQVRLLKSGKTGLYGDRFYTLTPAGRKFIVKNKIA